MGTLNVLSSTHLNKNRRQRYGQVQKLHDHQRQCSMGNNGLGLSAFFSVMVEWKMHDCTTAPSKRFPSTKVCFSNWPTTRIFWLPFTIFVKCTPKGNGRMPRGGLVILGSWNIVRRWSERYVSNFEIIEGLIVSRKKIQLLSHNFVGN